MIKPKDLKEKNIQALKTNNYSIAEIIKDANAWFDDLVIEVAPSSRGYKIACKKLADEVISLTKQVEELKQCQSTSEKHCLQVASFAAL